MTHNRTGEGTAREFIWIESEFIWIKSQLILINLECKGPRTI